MIKNWNVTLRWAHLLAGLAISGYFFFLPEDGYSAGVNNVYKFGVVGFVFWTGIIKWQLPRIRRWMKSRRAGAAA